ncbi:helix-turn-helix domain-containing protein [Arthrobacter sp. LAPM80]|uniref:helix-turn-helix domain-containing protein n=1 Tax=Arthrobacter sp. LAPM80 TaxID=3141788 RepID=UPI00398BA762
MHLYRHQPKGTTINTPTPATAPLPVDVATARDITGNIWLSRNDAAAYLGLSAKTLAQHLHDGPTYSKFFGSVKYRLSDLDNWARQQQVRR